MIKSLFLFIITSFLTVFSQPQNVTLLGSLNPSPTMVYSSLWGYTAPNGREYAILGVQNGTSIIDITNAAVPVQVAFIPGPQAAPYHWREMKTWGQYAYIVTEGSGAGTGMQIVDLSNLPVSAALVGTYTTTFTTAHDIYIDNGYAYVVGTGNGGGLRVISLANPTSPVQVGYYTGSGYIHDVHVYNDTAYCSAESKWDLVNVTNKSNPVRISSSAQLPGIYAHSGWLTQDKRYFISAEEFNVRDLCVWDLQDRTTWNLVVPTWQMPGTNPIHNIYIKGRYAHISYYKDGYVVLDLINPLAPVKVGQYDTYPGTGGGTYNGAWNCYPFFPSGKVIVSDMATGLYIFDFLLDNEVPVELTSFTATAKHNAVELNWITATETNNRGFEIERSADNQEWSTVGFVEGKGNSTSESRYTFTDKNPSSWKTYYRLVQIDFDGNKTIHEAVEAEILSLMNFELVQNYPNPFNPSTVISYTLPAEGFVSLKVYNDLGEEAASLVNSFQNTGAYNIKFDASGLTSGVYFYRLSANGSQQTKKMLLVR